MSQHESVLGLAKNHHAEQLAPVLFYPHYMPNKRWLRLLLLFYDQVRTIVPHEDQKKVLGLDYVEEIRLEDPDCIKLTPVTDDLFMEAINEETRGKIAALVEQIKTTVGHEAPVASQLTVDNIKRLRKEKGWVYVSAGKLGELINFELNQRDVAIQIPGELRDQLQDESILSEAPVLTHPKVAEFAISRLASTAAEEASAACVTNELSAYSFNAIRTGHTAPEDRMEAHLITETLDLVVPPEVEFVDVKRFQEIRGAFAEYRESFHSMMRFKLSNAGPLDPNQFDEYSRSIRDMAADVQRRAAKVERQIDRAHNTEWRRTSLRNVLILVGAGAGALMGQLPGALAGAALPIIFEPMLGTAMKLQPVRIHAAEPVRALAELRDSITTERGLMSMICSAYS